MAKTMVETIVDQLKREQARLRNELHGISAALAAFGSTYIRGANPARKRTISAAGRARIAAAQRARWAKVKAKRKRARSRTRASS